MLKKIFLLFCLTLTVMAQDIKILPVTPDASPEAVKLLNYLYSISGKFTLAGQHSVPLLGSLRLPAVHKTTGKYPALFGQDFGFSEPGSWDGINYRQQIVDEAIKRYHEGFIITLMWHAVPPNMDEPVDFSSAIQSQLSDEEWNELITDGTELNQRWKSQVDVIAWFLKQLKYAGVPVLWRPYHEMNGGWFWWGKKGGENGYKKLYRMLFDRLVNFHKLNNLLWVFNANEVKPGVDSYAEYYPGDDVVDILATDVYSEGFNQENYEELLELAKNKPIALGEVGALPSSDILEAQPRWVWFMHWSDPYSGIQSNPQFLEIYHDEKVITLDELPWTNIDTIKIHYPLLK
ncbi:glycoside hydrolase family 26 protein [Melioribacter sp. OK-6-Me]|uniref:glycoside hydrolase family 26 protein n=1 Tax=unclassified Melioribacter TaxID=2627329 RepID=UPI003ED976C3